MSELYTVIFLFFLSVISSSIVPAQAELVLFAFLSTGKYTAAWLLTACCAGAFLGTALNWVLGRYVAQFENKNWFPIKAAYLRKAENLFSKHGKITLLLAGVPFLGDPITLAAGAAKVNFSFFMATAAPAKACRFLLVWLIYRGIV